MHTNSVVNEENESQKLFKNGLSDLFRVAYKTSILASMQGVVTSSRSR
jgi:hypothetical protein